MSSTFRTLRFALETLSPVVIGDGNQTGLSPLTDYAISEDSLYYLDHARIETCLLDRPGALDRWVKSLRSGGYRPFDLADFLREETGEELEELAYRTLPLGDISQQYQSVIGTIVKSRGRAYLPGSTLKGSFKAALFWGWLMNHREGQQSLKQIISTAYRGGKWEVKKSVRLAEEKLFGKMVRHSRMDANRLRLGDSDLFAESALQVVAGQRFHFKKQSRAIPTPTEAIAPGEKSRFDLVHFQPGGGFAHEYLQQFESVEDYLTLFREYSHAFIDWEMEQLERHPQLEDIYLFYEDLRSNSTQSILRIGFGKGWYLNSIGLALEHTDPNAIHHLRTKLKVGKPGPFLRTRTVTLQDHIPMDPLGWVKLWDAEKS